MSDEYAVVVTHDDGSPKRVYVGFGSYSDARAWFEAEKPDWMAYATEVERITLREAEG